METVGAKAPGDHAEVPGSSVGNPCMLIAHADTMLTFLQGPCSRMTLANFGASCVDFIAGQSVERRRPRDSSRLSMPEPTMLRVVARLSDGMPFAQIATSLADALTIWRATAALVGDHENVWIEQDGQRLDIDQLRRDLALQNLADGAPPAPGIR